MSEEPEAISLAEHIKQGTPLGEAAKELFAWHWMNCGRRIDFPRIIHIDPKGGTST